MSTRSPTPSPQSQSFSQSYGSNLPTSLTYFAPMTRGCSPRKPDAVMGTTRGGIIHVFGFSRTIRNTPDTPADKALCLSISPISRRSVSRARNNYKEKTTLTRASHCNTKIIYVTMQYPHPGWGILTPFLFKKQSKACMCKTSPSLKIG